MEENGRLGSKPDRKCWRTATGCVMETRAGMTETLRQVQNDFI